MYCDFVMRIGNTLYTKKTQLVGRGAQVSVHVDLIIFCGWILNITLLACEISAFFGAFFGTALLWDWDVD